MTKKKVNITTKERQEIQKRLADSNPEKPWSKRKTAILLGVSLFLLPAIFLGKSLLPSWMLFGTDFVAGAYMSRKFLIETIRQFHTIPFWLPYVYGGVPYVDAGAADLFYPLSWPLRMLLPPHTVPPWLYLFHFALAGLLTYLFLRELGLGRIASSVSGFAYMFTGQIVTLIYAGHDGKVIVSSLLPGLFWLVHRGVRLKRLREFIWSGGFLGCILFSGHIQMVYYSLLALGLFWLVLLILQWRKEKKKTLVAKGVLGLAIFLILGFALTAVQYVPFYSYIPFSPRGGEEGRGIEFAKSWSMPPEETLNAIIPDFSGMSIGNTAYDTYWGQNIFKLHSEYLGVLPFLLAVLGVVLLWKEKHLRNYLAFFIGLLILGLLFAWGAYTPFFSLFYNLLPYYKKLRGSGMAFFLVSFSMACLAGLGAEAMLNRRGEGSKPGRNKRLILGLGITGGAALLLGLFVSGAREGLIAFLGNHFVHESQKYQQLQANYDHFVSGTFISALFLIVQVILLVLMLRRTLPKAWWAGLAIGLLVLDLWRIDFRFRQIESPPGQFRGFEPDEVVRVLEQDRSLYRVWPLRYDKMGNYLMVFNIRNVFGENPLPLRRYNEFVGTGETGSLDGHNLQDNPNFLNLLNVKYLITYFRAEDWVRQAGFVFPQLKLIADGTFKVYENLDVLPNAFCVGRYEVIKDPDKILDRIAQQSFDPKRIAIIEEEPEKTLNLPDSMTYKVEIDRKTSPHEFRLSCEVNNPCLLVLTDNYHPSWNAYVDGRLTKVMRADYTFRAIALPAGKHDIQFRFESRPFRSGLLISILALTLIATITAISLFPIKRHP